MVKCGSAGLQFRVSIGLGFRVRDKIRVSVRDRAGVRVSDGVGVRVSTFYFCHTSSPHFTHSRLNWSRTRSLSVEITAIRFLRLLHVVSNILVTYDDASYYTSCTNRL